MVAFANILLGGVGAGGLLFLVAAGLQLVFGVHKILNLACGSFYALGAYFGVSAIGYAIAAGLSPWLIMPALLLAGVALGFIGPPIERLLRTVYGRDDSLQLLLTFALVLMFQDVFRFVWGSNPRSLDSAFLIYGVLGSWRGALAGALLVGRMRAYAILVYPEGEVLAIYVIVIAVLLLRPAGLFGRPVT